MSVGSGGKIPGRRRTLISVLILLSCLLLCRPALVSAESLPLRVLVNEPQPGGPSEVPQESEQRLIRLLTEALAGELELLGFAVSRDPAETAELALNLRYLLNGERLTLVITVTDAASERVLGGGSYVGTTDLGLVNTIRQAAADTARHARAATGISGTHPEPPPVLQQLTLRSPNEGAGVEVAGSVPLGVIADGKLEAPFLPLTLGSKLVVWKHLDGYHSERQTILITDEHMDVQLPELRPRVNWEISLSWMPQRWAGAAVGVRRYLYPNRFYVQSTNQLSTRYRFESGSRASGVFDTRLSLGGYAVTALRDRFRLGLSTGAGVTLSLLGGEETAYFFADTYLKLFALAVRWQFDRFAPFLEADLIYYSEAATGYLVRGTHGYFSTGVLLPWRR